MRSDRHPSGLVVIHGSKVIVQPIDQRPKPNAIFLPSDYDFAGTVGESIVVLVMLQLQPSGVDHLLDVGHVLFEDWHPAGRIGFIAEFFGVSLFKSSNFTIATALPRPSM